MSSGRSSEITVESVRAAARGLGLDVNDAELPGLVERLRAATDDADSLNELARRDYEPAVTFGLGEESDPR